MALISAAPRIAFEDLPGADKWAEPLLQVQNEINEQIVAALDGALSLTENTTSKLVEVELTHGVARKFRNPLRVPVVAVIPLVAAEQKIAAWRYSPIQSKLGDQVQIAVDYELDHAQPFLSKTNTGAFNVANNTVTTVTWGTTTATRGSAISESAGTFTVSEAGTYAITTYAIFEFAVTYTRALLQIVTGGGTILSRSDISASLTQGPALNTSVFVDLAASDTFKVQAFHTNAAAVTRTLVASQHGVTVQRIHSTETPTDTVLCLVVGG
jgi:hypothetical protein